MGLLDAFKQYIKDALPGGLLNPEAAQLPGLLNAQANATAQAIKAKGQSFKRGLDDPQKYAGEAFTAGLDMAGMAPLGLTVWHGSPHKFNKFDMSKIGTGEGAQAYGHGLYMAESPAVAKSYSQLNPTVNAPPNRMFQGQELIPGTPEYHAGTLLEHSTLAKARKDVASWIAEGSPDTKMVEGWKKTLDTLNKATKKSDFKVLKNENLYKVDIPDEAVARMLDWDKPLSQQAPEVQKALEARQWDKKGIVGYWMDKSAENPAYNGGDLLQRLGAPDEASKFLRDAGIPGIRYLDGGSRSAGQGSSNFVLFDDQIPRILEINGQPTGQVPWKPSEWRGLLAP